MSQYCSLSKVSPHLALILPLGDEFQLVLPDKNPFRAHGQLLLLINTSDIPRISLTGMLLYLERNGPNAFKDSTIPVDVKAETLRFLLRSELTVGKDQPACRDARFYSTSHRETQSGEPHRYLAELGWDRDRKEQKGTLDCANAQRYILLLIMGWESSGLQRERFIAQFELEVKEV
ncbi:hypothetical protein L218DRAFT_941528 [Marasmius fiardii PR-910]|nr:hypothetical protein L218DRAFT_941528 [Marasmius fiardii PR-910]